MLFDEGKREELQISAVRRNCPASSVTFFLTNGMHNDFFPIFKKHQSLVISAIAPFGFLQRSFPFPYCRIRLTECCCVFNE